MSKYLKLYEQESAYITDLGNNELYVPNVAFCKDTNNVHYFSPAHESTALCATTLRDGKIVKVKQMVEGGNNTTQMPLGETWNLTVDRSSDYIKFTNDSASDFGTSYLTKSFVAGHKYLIVTQFTGSQLAVTELNRSYIQYIPKSSTGISTSIYTAEASKTILMMFFGEIVLKSLEFIDLTAMGIADSISSYSDLCDYYGVDELPYFPYSDDVQEYIALSGKLYKLTYPSCLYIASANYGFPLANIVKAYDEWSNVQYAFQTNSEGKYGFLVATGTQYIITGLKNVLHETLESRFYFSDSQYDAVYGCGNVEWGTGWTLLSRKFATAAWHHKNGQSFVALSEDAEENKVYHVKWSDSKIYVYEDEVLLALNGTEAGTGVSDYNMYLFAMNRGGNMCWPLNGGIAIIHSNLEGVCRYCYVPFKRNGEYGMLDLMTDTFYTNQGTGSFTYSLE